MSKIPVYMMPGLAASPKIFEYIKLPDMYQIHYLHWILPEKNEKLTAYVSRIIEKQIHEKNPILLGVSFGGIVVQEMAKQISVRQLILISTAKTHLEFPDFFDKSLRYHLYKLFPSRLMKHTRFLEKIAFTNNLKKKMKLYQIYMTMHQPQYLDWAILQVLQWKQEKFPENYIHIVGEKDKIFPLQYIKDPKIVVPKGRHDMIIFKASWFNRHLPELLIS